MSNELDIKLESIQNDVIDKLSGKTSSIYEIMELLKVIEKISCIRKINKRLEE